MEIVIAPPTNVGIPKLPGPVVEPKPVPEEDPDSALPDSGGVRPTDDPTDDGNAETEEPEPEEETNEPESEVEPQEEASDSGGEEE